MCGPAGTSGAAGGAPRAAALNVQMTVAFSSSQSQGSPQAALIEASLSGRVSPVATSISHTSMPLYRVSVKISREPSGEKLTGPSDVSRGASNACSAPSMIPFSVIRVIPAGRCGPLVRGFSR